MNTHEALQNLEQLSMALEKIANKPENYNTQYANHLEQMSWQMHRMCNEIRDIQYLFSTSI